MGEVVIRDYAREPRFGVIVPRQPRFAIILVASTLALTTVLLWSTKFGHKLRGCFQTLPLPWWALAHH